MRVPAPQPDAARWTPPPTEEHRHAPDTQAGAVLLDAARDAWVRGFGVALTVVAAVAAAGASVAAIWLPARGADTTEPVASTARDGDLHLVAA